MFSIGLFTACKKDEFVVDESSLYGTWNVNNRDPDEVVSHSISYVFNAGELPTHVQR